MKSHWPSLLINLGYRVTTKVSSVYALKVLSEQCDKFDLVITDMTMPKITGDQLCIEMRKIRADIPIIICTGFSEKMNSGLLREWGSIDACLHKPFNLRVLANTVRTVLKPENFEITAPK